MLKMFNKKCNMTPLRMADSDSDWSTDDDSDGDIEDTVFDTKAPRPIKISTPVNSAKFHPTQKLFVAGDFDGVIQGKFDSSKKSIHRKCSKLHPNYFSMEL